MDVSQNRGHDHTRLLEGADFFQNQSDRLLSPKVQRIPSHLASVAKGGPPHATPNLEKRTGTLRLGM